VADRDDPRTLFSRMLIEKVRQDEHPSTTQMEILEQTIPRELLRDYIAVLLEKVARDPAPSITLLHRIARLTQVA
jgi:hypothetical protein